MDKQSLKQMPFYLSDEDIHWIDQQISDMSLDEKAGQLFCMIAYDSDENHIKAMLSKYHPGGVMLRPMPLKEAVLSTNLLQKNSKIPMLLAANLEKGSNGVVEGGNSFGSQMQVAATDNIITASRMGTVCGREGGAIGVNWSFAPIIDIDYNFRNPITNTRTLGSDPVRVKEMGKAYVEAIQAEGLAASIKHFPGDGRDERDQHLVTSINDMTCEAWDETYGEAYKASIEAGAKTVMVGHIMHPEYSRKLDPSLKDEDIMPATLAPELINGLLRDKLEFNGLVVSDATTMAGMTIAMPRNKAVPMCIAAGCDMFLFARNLEEDFAFMKAGIEDGTITSERLEEALTRILALKASLGLHNGTSKPSLTPTEESAKSILDTPEHKAWTVECAGEAITIVKEEANVLPITPSCYKRVLLYGIEAELGYAYSVRGNMPQKIKGMLEDEGFEVNLYEPSPGFEGMTEPFSKVTENYDLIIYIANMATKSNQTTVRIEWAMPMGANVPIYSHSVPTIFISLENPYHLLDVPRVRTYINTYASTDVTIEALMHKLTGGDTFRGTSPVDAFCGRWDTHLQ